LGNAEICIFIGTIEPSFFTKSVTILVTNHPACTKFKPFRPSV
jgi:hypothetical protein